MKDGKITAVHAACVGLSLAAVIGVTATGASIVQMLNENSMRDVYAAENRANNYLISLRDETDRMLDEQHKKDVAALEEAIADAEKRSKDALEDHIRDADDRFKGVSDRMDDIGDGDDHSSDGMSGRDVMSMPATGEEGFNEP